MTLHIVDVRLTCLINITYLLTYLLTCSKYQLKHHKLEQYRNPVTLEL